MPDPNENILEMSDEDFANAPKPDFDAIAAKMEESGDAPEIPAVDEDIPAVEPGDTPAEDGVPETPEVEPKIEDLPDEDIPEVPPIEDGDTPPVEEPEVDQNKAEPKKEDDKGTKEPAIDHQKLYEDMLLPFKANGGEVTPKSHADLLRLAQMGANYHKKMAGMKPAVTALKTLENNGLIGNDELSFLIDIKNGNPEAIAKLLKEHKIDPADVDTQVESTYVPTDHTASEAEVVLDQALSDLRGTSTGDTTLDIVSNKWDAVSQERIANKPELLGIINKHVELGIYDTIAKEITYKRSLGQLDGVSDIDAYKTIGDELETAGAFKETTPAKEVTKEPAVPLVDPVAEKARLAKKAAASPTKQSKAVVAKVAADFNPLDLSDEEFAKFDASTIGIKK